MNKTNLRKINKNKGEMLIESVVAIAVVSFIMVGIVSALIAAVNNSTFSKNQNLATNYAQEGIEIARDLKESDFNSFSSLTIGNYCLGDGVINLVTVQNSCPPNIPSVNPIFSRSLFIIQSLNPECSNESGSIFVASTVKWSDSRCDSGVLCHKVELNSCFSNLDRLPAL